MKLNLKHRFPIFQTHPELTYLDSAASTQKPDTVLEKVNRFYRERYANIHRGMYTLSVQATDDYDRARERVARFINAPSPDNLVFLRNATEGINLVAQSWGRQHVNADSNMVITIMEHHANFVPWQTLASQTGAELRIVPMTQDTLEPDLDAMDRMVDDNTALVAVTMASNVLGTVPDVDRILQLARQNGAVTLLDAAQYVPHHPLDIQSLDPDFLVFSGHKMLALDGIGVLYGRRDLLDTMPPFLTGGDMIERVTVDRTTWAPVPQKFEAGTPFIAGAVSLHAAIDFLEETGLAVITEHERVLACLAHERLEELGGVTLYRSFEQISNGILPFNVDGVHPHDTATILAEENVCVRAGHHCAAPLIDTMDEMALARASFYVYNDEADVDRLVQSVRKVKELFRK